MDLSMFNVDPFLHLHDGFVAFYLLIDYGNLLFNFDFYIFTQPLIGLDEYS